MNDVISVTKGTSNPAWYFWLASLPLLRLLWCLHVHKVSVMRHEIIRVTSFQELASQPVANHHAVSKGSCSDLLTIMTDAPVDDGDAVICDMQRQSSQSLVLACSNPLAVTWCSNPSRSPQTVVCLYFSCLLVCRVCYTSRTAAHRPDLHPQLGSIWVRRRSLASDKWDSNYMLSLFLHWMETGGSKLANFPTCRLSSYYLLRSHTKSYDSDTAVDGWNFALNGCRILGQIFRI